MIMDDWENGETINHMSLWLNIWDNLNIRFKKTPPTHNMWFLSIVGQSLQRKYLTKGPSFCIILNLTTPFGQCQGGNREPLLLPD